MPDKTLLLIDAMAFAYRAFHAIPELSTRSGQPTNAVFGFIKMQKQLVERWAPTHLAVVFDGGLPEARMTALPEYKAHRPPMPDGLVSQLSLLDEYLDAARIASLRLDGEEADDLMATLAGRARQGGATVLLASSDKDLFQLVGDGVVVVSPVKAGETMGPAEVELKTGVPPSLIPEWLALIGDDVDNIPGVPGVGAKTAAKLLREFGTLDQLWARLGEIKQPRLREELERHQAAVTRNLAVVRLRMELPVPLDWTALERRGPEVDRLIGLYDRLELRSMAAELRDAASRLF
jgi:DNA polymerase-1